MGGERRNGCVVGVDDQGVRGLRERGRSGIVKSPGDRACAGVRQRECPHGRRGIRQRLPVPSPQGGVDSAIRGVAVEDEDASGTRRTLRLGTDRRDDGCRDRRDRLTLGERVGRSVGSVSSSRERDRRLGGTDADEDQGEKGCTSPPENRNRGIPREALAVLVLHRRDELASGEQKQSEGQREGGGCPG